MSQNFELMLRSRHHELLRPRLGPRFRAVARRYAPLDGCGSDAIRPLVQRLFLSPRVRPGHRRVVFAGADAATGSASVCMRTARALAASAAGTVCAVDLNLSSPSMHHAFGVPLAPGVANLVEHAAGCVETREIAPGLALLPAGCDSRGRDGALTPDGVSALFDELGEVFDWVLADLGQIEPGSAASAVTSRADGVVLVVRACGTRRDMALQAKQAIATSGGRLLGTVLTDHTAPDEVPT